MADAGHNMSHQRLGICRAPPMLAAFHYMQCRYVKVRAALLRYQIYQKQQRE